MKTYISDTFNRFRRFSEKLDAGTVLCNKCWWVFNDNGEKESYIFNNDGTVLITNKGIVTDGTWQYLPVNKSVVIRASGQSYMVHPFFVDDVILVLQVDGTNQYAFLIDEQNKKAFAPSSYKEITDYFEEKTHKPEPIPNPLPKRENADDTEPNTSNDFAYVLLMVVIFSIVLIILFNL